MRTGLSFEVEEAPPMRQTYITIWYLPGMEQDDHGKQQQCRTVQVEAGILLVWSHEHYTNPTEYRAIPLVHIREYQVKEYR